MSLLRAIEFASVKHINQRRKDAIKAPYINHCIRVASIAESIGKINDEEQLIAAVLHDTLEDTETSEVDIESLFGRRVLNLVKEMTDDKSLSKQERKQLQIDHAPQVSEDVAPIKLADKIANCEDLLISAPVSWDDKRIYEYYVWADKVVAQLPRNNVDLYQYVKSVITKGLVKYRA